MFEGAAQFCESPLAATSESGAKRPENGESAAVAAGPDQLMIGRFGLRVLTAAGLGPLLNDVSAGKPVSAADFYKLAGLDFPLLAKFVEAVRGASGAVRVRPVVFSPLAERLERLGPAQAINETAAQLTALDAEISWDGPIAVAIDRWHGNFALEDLITALDRSIHAGAGDSPLRNNFCALGPSTADISASGAEPQGLFYRLQAIGIDTIEGGEDLEIHALAGRAGLNSVVGQDIGISIQKVGAPRQTAEGVRPAFYRALLEKFQAVQEAAERGAKIDTWFPRLPAQFDRGPAAVGPSTGEQSSESHAAPGEPSILGLELCRVFMLARIALPAVIHVRAPLAKVGPRLASAALALGANDLGFAAFDPVTAKTLGVLEISKIGDIVPSERVFSRII